MNNHSPPVRERPCPLVTLVHLQKLRKTPWAWKTDDNLAPDLNLLQMLPSPVISQVVLSADSTADEMAWRDEVCMLMEGKQKQTWHHTARLVHSTQWQNFTSVHSPTSSTWDSKGLVTQTKFSRNIPRIFLSSSCSCKAGQLPFRGSHGNVALMWISSADILWW